MERAWRCLEFGFALVGLGIVVVALMYAFKQHSESAANWVQAVGAIGAIVGAAWLGRRQMTDTRDLQLSREQAALLRRWSSVKSVIDSLYQQCVDVESVFEGHREFGSLSFYSKYDVVEYRRSLARLEAVPIFDLDSAELVSAVIGLQQHAWNLEKLVDEGIQRKFGNGDMDGASDADVKGYARGELHYIHKHYDEVVRIAGGTPITKARLSVYTTFDDLT
ncbi:hypothetical protein [Pandoraea sp. PE-S2R-1]|uniref:hypothetical protein n=1 Tax=Pandoraea sp. PE-S2R-1 TaxID=1986994 RepID=UPI000B3FF832|nr:hypothetical protein [Pandoraea sp. PE-S2R-1]